MTISQTRQAESDRSEALGWLVAHGDALLSYAVARVPDQETAEDLVQETFLAALADSGSFRGDSAVRTWLVSILRRRIADHYRAQSRRPKAARLEADDCQPGHSSEQQSGRGKWRGTPTDSLENAEFWSTLERCLAKLPKNLAGAFVLRVMDGVEVEELCNLFDISPTNLGVRLHRARVGLRDCLTRSWF